MSYRYYGKELYHYGTSGMKWGYADGQRVSGKRIAADALSDAVQKKDYASVQDNVNKMLQAGHSPEQIQAMLNKSIAGQNSAPINTASALDAAVKSKDYASVQENVNKLLKEGHSPEEIEKMLHESMGVKDNKKKKSDADVVNDVIKGKYGNGENRKEALKKAGYDYNKIQGMVNKQLKSSSSKSKKTDTKKTESKKDTQTKTKSAVYVGNSSKKKPKYDERQIIRDRIESLKRS